MEITIAAYQFWFITLSYYTNDNTSRTHNFHHCDWMTKWLIEAFCMMHVWMLIGAYSNVFKPGPEVMKLFSCSTLWSMKFEISTLPGRVAQSVTCLATDACLTADPGVASSILVRSHTFVEIDHEMISTVILLPSADSFKKGCCQLQAKVCARITG